MLQNRSLKIAFCVSSPYCQFRWKLPRNVYGEASRIALWEPFIWELPVEDVLSFSPFLLLLWHCDLGLLVPPRIVYDTSSFIGVSSKLFPGCFPHIPSSSWESGQVCWQLGTQLSLLFLVLWPPKRSAWSQMHSINILGLIVSCSWI